MNWIAVLHHNIHCDTVRHCSVCIVITFANTYLSHIFFIQNSIIIFHVLVDIFYTDNNVQNHKECVLVERWFILKAR